ncbi:uncharacterized protein G2W53_022716 [Senna tora]|uniref:Bifunctional inhibitor/plant lipid transfer protein/seed storage helical domain-containing protein n=1 Tax=Senna tora TaxID=362788 RepID=A0A834WJ14_9FABA|nr:uncharacterized protein G2W53_022716 [Senna tora]
MFCLKYYCLMVYFTLSIACLIFHGFNNFFIDEILYCALLSLAFNHGFWLPAVPSTTTGGASLPSPVKCIHHHASLISCARYLKNDDVVQVPKPTDACCRNYGEIFRSGTPTCLCRYLHPEKRCDREADREEIGRKMRLTLGGERVRGRRGGGGVRRDLVGVEIGGVRGMGFDPWILMLGM